MQDNILSSYRWCVIGNGVQISQVTVDELPHGLQLRTQVLIGCICTQDPSTGSTEERKSPKNPSTYAVLHVIN